MFQTLLGDGGRVAGKAINASILYIKNVKISTFYIMI